MKDCTNRFFLHVDIEKNKNAGHKAVNDCEIIMRQMGYGQVRIKKSQAPNQIMRNIQNTLQLVKLLFVKKNIELVVQHPMHINWGYMLALKYMKKIRNVRLIFIIHDFEVLRGLLKDRGSIKKDQILLNIADVMIVHNDKMKKYFIEKQGVSENKLYTLGIFDYLVDEAIFQKKDNKNEVKQNEIVVAGNLSKEKSAYIYELDKICSVVNRINLYGLGLAENAELKNCVYKGAYEADILPTVLEGKYGLVWDGTMITTCAGNTGNYMRYNNPHKVSLYVAAELPIIIWNQAALADFVLENQIGIAVDSLEKLEEEIGKISQEKYMMYKENLKAMSLKVRKGECLKKALENIQL